MEWSAQQERAVDSVGAWLRRMDKPWFRLDGYAGTGKTTIARHLSSQVPGKVFFAAFTGKAALVLRQAGCPNPSTIHKLIYLPRNKCLIKLRQLEEELLILGKREPQPQELIDKVVRLIEEEKKNLSRPSWKLNTDSELKSASLLIVDESSMIDQQMGEDLLSFNCPVLALGDPGQLPPVRGSSFFQGKPDFMLTEIHRQAKDNPIIWMSKEVREGRALRPGTYGESSVAVLSSVPQDTIKEMVLQTDQLLVGRNTTRRASNRRIRELLGRKDTLPEVNDKVICLRNNHQLSILNGQLFKVQTEPLIVDEQLSLDLVPEDDSGEPVIVLAHTHYFLGKSDGLDVWTKLDAEEFDYGYALTVHKAQGSQWGKVTLFDEWHQTSRDKWLYTAITRAREKIDILTM